MYRPCIEQLLILITSIDDKAAVRYSTVTGMFYVHADIWRKEEKNFTHSAPHESTMEGAIREYYKMIQGKIIKRDKGEDTYLLPKLIA